MRGTPTDDPWACLMMATARLTVRAPTLTFSAAFSADRPQSSAAPIGIVARQMFDPPTSAALLVAFKLRDAPAAIRLETSLRVDRSVNPEDDPFAWSIFEVVGSPGQQPLVALKPLLNPHPLALSSSKSRVDVRIAFPPFVIAYSGLWLARWFDAICRPAFTFQSI